LYRGGFRQEMVALSPFGKAVPQNVQDTVLKARQGFIDDTLKLYKGPLKDNKGTQVLAAGQEISNTDNGFKLNVKWLVEGAIGSTGLQGDYPPTAPSACCVCLRRSRLAA